MFTVFFTPASGRNRAFPYSASYSFYTAFAPIQLPHMVPRTQEIVAQQEERISFHNGEAVAICHVVESKVEEPVSGSVYTAERHSEPANRREGPYSNSRLA